MTTIVDQRTQPSLAMGYDQFRYGTSPQFTDPWASSRTATNPAAVYQSLPTATSVQPQPTQSRQNSLSYSPEQIQQAKAIYYNGYSTQSPQAYAPTHRYSTDSYQPSTSYAYDQLRRTSYPTKPPLMGRDSYNDVIDASQGMVAMSQTDVTPRAPYGRHGSIDSYGFPNTHSHQSSISSTGYPQYYHHGSYSAGSVDGSVAGSSVTDYSSEAESVMASRMPSAVHMANSYHQDQAAMMTQFNSKMSASAQKKHKCKICDKRFTRPSSLQTHMYSHTGEKPFACDFDGCGRHFSVVSNLRRHKKCHRNGNDHPSSDGENRNSVDS